MNPNNIQKTLGEHEARISSLEANNERTFDAIITLTKKVDSLIVAVERHHALPVCPSPGVCLTLAKDLKLLSDRLEALEKERERRIGERTVLSTLSGIVGAGIMWLAQVIFNHHAK